jgi:prepilin-type N-terminal cleavage/methylation domain-containing protein
MHSPKMTERRTISMKNEQGFSLIELLIVVAIIAVIAAIAVPSLLQARMAANESGAIQGCRTVGSAEVAFSAVNNQNYSDLAGLVTGNFLDSRFDPAGHGFNGYTYADTAVKGNAVGPGTTFAVIDSPVTADSTGRYKYGITVDQIVYYEGKAGNAAEAMCGASACVADTDPIGTQH